MNSWSRFSIASSWGRSAATISSGVIKLAPKNVDVISGKRPEQGAQAQTLPYSKVTHSITNNAQIDANRCAPFAMDFLPDRQRSEPGVAVPTGVKLCRTHNLCSD